MGLGGSVAFAQSASQITPPNFRPSDRLPTGGLMIPDSSSIQIPPGAEKLRVWIGRVEYSGGRPELDAVHQEIATSLSKRIATTAELFEAARKLENAYIKAGYGLVRVVLPAQRLKHLGVLRFVLIDGYIEKVDTSNLPKAIELRVREIMDPVLNRRGLLMSELERRLVLAGDIPGTSLRSTLTPGSVQGASVLVLEARYKAVTGQFSVDNTGGKSLGVPAVGFGLDLNALLFSSESIYLRVNGAPFNEGGVTGQNPRNRMVAAGFVLPIGDDGWSINLEASNSATTPHTPTKALATTSSFDRYSTRLRYGFIRSRGLSATGELAFDVQNEVSDFLYSARLGSEDRLRVLRPSLETSWREQPKALLTARVAAAFGISGLGARDVPLTNTERPLSRLGAGPNFSKLEASLNYSYIFGDFLTVDMRLRGQTSFGKSLPRSEMFGLVGATAVSSFDTGQFQGDSGYLFRTELQFNNVWNGDWGFRVPEFPAQEGTGLPPEGNTTGVVTFIPYLFGSFGTAIVANPTVLEFERATAGSFGLGFRTGAAPQASFSNSTFSAEYGRQVSSGDGPNGHRLTFATNIQF
jgi:hemolysin activation/secretion protein